MNPSQPTRRVYFLEDVCRELRCSRSTVKRLRRFGAFPIPELPSIDKRPRWSADAVEAFLHSQQSAMPASRRLRAVRSR